MKAIRSTRFKKAWGHLAEGEKALARKAITNLLANMRYPSLRIKKIQGAEDIWEARVSRSARLTFQIKDDTIILRNVGPHDETLGNP